MKTPAGPVPPHYIRHNQLSRLPKDYVAISVSGRLTDSSTVVWRSARAIFSRVTSSPPDVQVGQTLEYADRGALWRDIAAVAVKQGKIIVVSMTLADDVRLSAGIPWLISNGWTMDRLNVRDDAFSGAFHKGKARVTLVELRSWLPGTISRIARMVGVELTPNLDYSDSDDLWSRELDNRVKVTHAAAVDLWTWIRDDDLGNWKTTGAGMAWANWRHKHYTDKVLMHGRPELMDLERKAAATGRAEAWQHGNFVDVEFTEWDLTLAYPAIAMETELPIAYSGEMRGASLRLMTNPPQGKRYLIEATVTQETPTLGVQVTTGWVWPVGTIRGVWWDHELREAVADGATVEVHACHYYKAAYALRDWALWIFEYLYESAPGATVVRQAACKHFGRGLIGRFGVRYDTWVKEGQAPLQGYYTATQNDYETNVNTPALVLGSDLFLSSGKQWGHDAIPQVMSAIMSECRVRLWQLMKVAGHEHVIYVDTDALITDQHGSVRLESWTSQNPQWGLRPKHTYDTLEVMGPRQLLAPVRSKLSGVPATAARTAQRTFKGQVMDGIAGTMASGAPDTIRIATRTWNLVKQDNRRKHLPGGATMPYRAQTTAKGTIIP